MTWRRESQVLSRFFVFALATSIAWVIASLPLLWAVLLVGSAIFVTLVFIQPRWGLYVLPFAVPFGSIREIAIGPATVGGTEAILGLFLAAWLARGIARRDLRLRQPPLWGAILLWYGVMLFSTLNSLSLSASIKELIKWGETFALYTIAVQELRRRDIAIILTTTLAAGTLAALEGIYQAVFQVGPSGFLFPLAGRLWLRAYGRFIQPNPYAGYLGLVLPLAYGLIMVGVGLGGRGRQITSTSWPTTGAVSPTFVGRGSPRFLRYLTSHAGLTLLAGAATAIMLLALFLTLSRGAWIGAGVAAVAVSALLSRRAALFSLFLAIALSLGVALGGAQLLPEVLANRLTDFLPYINVFNVDVRGIGINDQNFAVIERLAHWQAAYAMWADAPWLGQGVGNYAAVYPAYLIPPWEDPLGHAHNLFLNTLAETGLIGLGAYLIFWIGALWLTFQAVRRSKGMWRGMAVGTLGAMVHLHVHNFFDNLYVHGMYLHIALLLAIAAILSRGAVFPQEIE
ncbi:MAG: O-antigen ligase family protein [Chloroflexota bacterium]|nr:O-antigen ligase family protein [Chloroflexota bacterium]